jgi:PBP1b-binding outer membrane lipoprotein LpoB
MKRSAYLASVFILAACSKQPAADMQSATNNATEKQLEKDAKTIEQAADEAAKLVEEDARKDAQQPQ